MFSQRFGYVPFLRNSGPRYRERTAMGAPKRAEWAGMNCHVFGHRDDQRQFRSLNGFVYPNPLLAPVTLQPYTIIMIISVKTTGQVIASHYLLGMERYCHPTHHFSQTPHTSPYKGWRMFYTAYLTTTICLMPAMRRTESCCVGYVCKMSIYFFNAYCILYLCTARGCF